MAKINFNIWIVLSKISLKCPRSSSAEMYLSICWDSCVHVLRDWSISYLINCEMKEIIWLLIEWNAGSGQIFLVCLKNFRML